METASTPTAPASQSGLALAGPGASARRQATWL